MSLTITDSVRVACLTCNTKVERSSTKNINKTKFTQTGESLASFVSSTLLLTAAKFRSSYLCSKCLSLFGKLEAASRKVKNIKIEIQKVFEDSYHAEKNIPVTIYTVEKGSSPTKRNSTQDSSTKPKVVIRRCVQRKSVNPSVENKTICYASNLGLSVNSENKIISILQMKNERPGAKWINLIDNQESLKTADSHAEAVANTLTKNNKLCIISDISLNDDVELAPSLKDHQYGQLPITKCRNSIDNTKVPLSSSKVVSTVQQQVTIKKEKKVLEPKTLELPNSESLTCSSCGIKKDTLRDLTLHCKTHAELYPYMCEKCGKVYKSKISLRLHIKTHDRMETGTKHICTICNKCFSQKSALKRHMPIHTGETPYECQICLKKFIHHTSYQVHILVHTREKKYKCDICSLAFMSTSHLKRHLKTHTGEKQHSCHICGKSFYERYNVVAHMKIHEPRPYRVKGETGQPKRIIQRSGCI